MTEPPNCGNATHTPPVIGLIGGIGAGKSEVARILAELGCLVVASDDLARQALIEPEVKEEIRQLWGNDVFNEHGEVDRVALARIIFSDDGERKQLEAIIHPRVEAARRATFSAAPPDTPALVIDAPLLLEAGVDRECNHVIFVDTPVETRRRRVHETRGWTAADLARREAAQFPLDVKRKRADSSVQNDGDLDSLREQVRQIFQNIMHAYR